MGKQSSGSTFSALRHEGGVKEGSPWPIPGTQVWTFIPEEVSVSQESGCVKHSKKPSAKEHRAEPPIWTVTVNWLKEWGEPGWGGSVG